MDNQHRLIKGYRDLTAKEVSAMNEIKLAEQDIGQLWQKIRDIPGVDQRSLSLAKTGLQEAFTWFVRAVAQPLDVFELKIQTATPAPTGKISELGLPVTFHVGVKEIFAAPMTRAEYTTYRGWVLPEDENGEDAGYLVEYVAGGAPNVSGHSGYVSWSPAEVFINAYGEPK